MILSPALVLLAGAGAVALWHLRRPAGMIVAAVLVVGVAWTDALTASHAAAAPHDRLAELQRIDDRFAGEGPLLYTEFEEFGKWFLRDTDPTGASEMFRPDLLRGATPAAGRFGFTTDLDDYTPESLAAFRLLLVRDGPAASRPPSGWRRAFDGRYYEVWRREARPPRVLAHLRLGDQRDPGAQPPCADVGALAIQAGAAHGRLAYAERSRVFTALPRAVPPGWLVDTQDAALLRPSGAGTIESTVEVPAGSYRVWLEGSFADRASVRIDGKLVGAVQDERSPRSTSFRLGTVRLSAGSHDVTTRRHGGSEPRKTTTQAVGPVLLTSAGDPLGAPVRTVAPYEWRSLCGRHLDWVEAVVPAGAA
jgi:hypothetical protein